jgi:hypothetical protein
MIRTQHKTVDTYLDYVKQYAELTREHAQTLCQELWPKYTSNPLQLYASFPLQSNTPEALRKRLEALSASPDAAGIRHVFVCPTTLTVYIFGIAK